MTHWWCKITQGVKIASKCPSTTFRHSSVVARLVSVVLDKVGPIMAEGFCDTISGNNKTATNHAPSKAKLHSSVHRLWLNTQLTGRVQTSQVLSSTAIILNIKYSIEAFLYFISKSVCFAQYHGTMEFTLNIKCQLIHYFIGLNMSPNVKSCQL